jgi:glycosyltransferase involved in cell wall biosynthesis
MKIVLSSHAFYPNLGGLESVSEGLAAEWMRLGHEVRVVTQTPGADKPEWKFEVVRQPCAGELMKLVRWSDIFFHNNISLQTAWPLLFVRRPWVIAHQTWIARLDGSMNWQDHLKRRLLRWATNVSISRAVAASLPVDSSIIANPYRDDFFRQMPEVARDKTLVFLGRLVSDKGADLLIEALKLLKTGGVIAGLTIIGSGPEEERLKAMAQTLGVDRQIYFAGPRSGDALARLLNEHRLLVVPSRWAEPFGIVALEGIACGCAVVGSEAGGLADAIGACGLTFPNGNAPALAAALREVLTREGLFDQLRSGAPEHLARHTSGGVASAYLKLFQRLLA